VNRVALKQILKEEGLVRLSYKSRYTLKRDGYVTPSDGRYAEWLSAGTVGKVVDEGEDEDGAFVFLEVKFKPGPYSDNPTPFTRTYTVTEDELQEEWR
jgi:hypothetical protein